MIVSKAGCTHTLVKAILDVTVTRKHTGTAAYAQQQMLADPKPSETQESTSTIQISITGLV